MEEEAVIKQTLEVLYDSKSLQHLFDHGDSEVQREFLNVSEF